MGNNRVLIRSASEAKTEEVLKGCKEWISFWMDWWTPWLSSDVNQNRVVWTRWIGVPLQAWSKRFFELGCSKFGSLVEIYRVTEEKSRLDEAYVRISTGLTTIDKLWNCNIGGKKFQIKIEEIRCLVKELELHLSWDSCSETTSETSEYVGRKHDESVVAILKSSLEKRITGDSLVIGGGNASNLVARGEHTYEPTILGFGITAERMTEAVEFQNSVGIEVESTVWAIGSDGPEKISGGGSEVDKGSGPSLYIGDGGVVLENNMIRFENFEEVENGRGPNKVVGDFKELDKATKMANKSTQNLVSRDEKMEVESEGIMDQPK